MIYNLTRKTPIASRVKVARNPWQRMKGLMGTGAFLQGEALIITRCQSIHMFFMKFPIDVIFCNKQNNVVGLCANIRPFCLSPIFFKASYAIELPSGTIAASKTQIGDRVQV
ncbi:MAG: DUF192 domain-containing protein [Candidatus Omnitrophica bacterium]|nr:DUF192 domain-containing protein [Candidatus Omnitrophota bacterium]